MLSLIFGAMAISFFSCSRDEGDEKSVVNNKKTTETTFANAGLYEIYNVNNPYDKYGEQLIELFKKFNVIVSSKDKYTEKEYQIKIDSLIKNTTVSYPTFSYKEVMDLDSVHFSNILNTFIKNLKKGASLSRASIIAEDDIIANVRNRNKQRIYLCIISELKYSLYASDMVFYAPTQAERFDNCMYNKMYDIENGNWIDKVAFFCRIANHRNCQRYLLRIRCNF